jgi:hypothetical protein
MREIDGGLMHPPHMSTSFRLLAIKFSFYFSSQHRISQNFCDKDNLNVSKFSDIWFSGKYLGSSCA